MASSPPTRFAGCARCPPTPIIGDLGKDGLRLWAYKHLDRVARKATGRDDVTPYTLRHSHASACKYCG
jgi:integrase